MRQLLSGRFSYSSPGQNCAILLPILLHKLHFLVLCVVGCFAGPCKVRHEKGPLHDYFSCLLLMCPSHHFDWWWKQISVCFRRTREMIAQRLIDTLNIATFKDRERWKQPSLFKLPANTWLIYYVSQKYRSIRIRKFRLLILAALFPSQTCCRNVALSWNIHRSLQSFYRSFFKCSRSSPCSSLTICEVIKASCDVRKFIKFRQHKVLA